MKTSTTIPEVTHFIGIKQVEDWCGKPYPKSCQVTRLDNGLFQVTEGKEYGDYEYDQMMECFEFTHYVWFEG